VEHRALFSATGSFKVKVQQSFKQLSFKERGQVAKEGVAMVDPMAMCALAQKLLRRQEPLPGSTLLGPTARHRTADSVGRELIGQQ